MMDQRINDSLKELEQSLKNLDSARKQVEKTIESYDGLHDSVSEYVAQLEKITTKVEELIEKSSTRIGSFNKYHIWTREHVKSYLGGNSAKIWLLRVYKLKEPAILSRTQGMLYANVSEEVSLDGMTPVISDEDFEDLKSKILKI